jgi:serine/threonine protein kinase
MKISRPFVLTSTLLMLLVSTVIQPVSAAGPLTTPGNGGVARLALERPGVLFSSLLSSLVLFAILVVISLFLILFIRQWYLSKPSGQPPGIPRNHTLPAAGAYIVFGAIMAMLEILIMTSLLATPSGSLAVSEGKVVCGLCVYLSVSSFFLAHDVLRAKSFPGLTVLHGILAALAIPGFVYLVIVTPDRRETTLFLLVVVLASSVVLSAWYYRRQVHQKTPAGVPVAGKIPPLPVKTSSPPPDQSRGNTDLPPGEDYPAPPAGPGPAVPDFPPSLVDKYYNVSCIGRGGFATVYAGNRVSDRQKVAIKIPNMYNEITGKSFLKEIRVWETLHHPNIVRVTSVNILPVPYVEMEFVPSSLVAVHKPVPVAQALTIIRQVAEAISYAHGLGIIHRDIKPHNILMTSDLVPKITDWGMSKDLSVGDKNMASIIGFSLDYASPEQISPKEFGKTDQRTDIYQIGVVFYELVTGSVPFGGGSVVDTGKAILHQIPKPPSASNPEAAMVDAVILKCLEKDPSRRFPSGADLLDALFVIESGKLDMEYSAVPVHELLSKILDSGGYAAKADIVTEIPEGLRFECDAGKIEIVLDTLLSNAVRYAKPPRKIRVTYQSSQNDLFHHLAVQDNGVGITEAQLDLIFRQSRETGTLPPGRTPEKTGISLALAKKYVQLHGGYITVDSVVSVGSTFTIHLPKIPPKKNE